MAGVPFAALDQLATVEIAEQARQIIPAQTELAQRKTKVEAVLASRRHDLSREQFRAWRKAILHGVMPLLNNASSTVFRDCWEAAARLAEIQPKLDESLLQQIDAARRSLVKSAREYLPRYLVFAATGLRELLGAASERSLPPRKKNLRARERHLLLYLQRVCGKNDTLSEFGPHSWGRTNAEIDGVEFAPAPGITEREVFLERWTARGIAAAMNADPEVRFECAPVLYLSGRLEGDRFCFTETGATLSIDTTTAALLAQCDGIHPAHSLGAEEMLRRLAEQKLIRWEMEVPALDPYAFDILVRDLLNWRQGPARARWLEQLEPLAALARDFAAAVDPQRRLAIMSEAGERLERLGTRKEASRFLYTAANPIGEECFRESHFTISEKLINEVAIDGAPWIDLWRDSYAFIAGRVATGLRAIFEQAPLQNGALPLANFLRRCAEAQMPLSGAGMVALAHLAFREVKEAFRESLGDRADERQCQLSAEDCHFVRRDFSYAKFDECTYPSADLQLASASSDAVAAGDYQWILAELHPPVALLHHGFYWSCPEKEALSRAIAQTLCGKPYLYYGYFAADFTATTAVRLDALAQHVKFVAPQRSVGPWETFRTADTEVFIDESGDVGVRTCDSKRYLGSFARGWVIPLGFHPFSFSLGRHTPRLLCGNVVVQREAWVVSLEELGRGDFTGISRDLVVAVERLRAARGLPRHIYIRPTEQALRRAGVEGRDKDTKPVFIDLESYLFLEIFHRWLVKAGEIEITEMLPRPDQLLWQEADGRRTFELRTQIVPA